MPEREWAASPRRRRSRPISKRSQCSMRRRHQRTGGTRDAGRATRVRSLPAARPSASALSSCPGFLLESHCQRRVRDEPNIELHWRSRGLSLSLRPMAAMPSRFDSTMTRGTRRSYRRSSLSTPLECLGEGFEPLDLIWKRVAVYPAERDLGAGKERKDALGRHQLGLAETPEAGRALIEGAGGCTPSRRRPEGSVRRSSPCGVCGGAKHGVDGGASLPSDE
jgi:hypothetical protein